MTFLTPLFLLGLAALAIPVLIHLTQRERTTVVEFPSLMFLKKIPYESVKRRRLRDLLLLALRAAALALIVAAFARPFLRGSELVASGGGAREVVVLLDRSYSMGAADTWARAQQAARQAVQGLTGLDRVSLVLFSSSAELVLRSSADVSRVVAEIDRAQPSAGATRYAPPLKVASSVLAESSLPRKEAVLVSDFQRVGWQPDEAFRLPAGSAFTPVAVEPPSGSNLAVTPISVQRVREGTQDRVVITGGVMNRSVAEAANVRLDLEVDGRVVQSQPVSVAAASSASVTFAAQTLPPAGLRVVTRLPGDSLAADNAFHAVLAPSTAVTVLLVGSGNRGDSDLYLTRALAIGDRPRFEASIVQADSLSAETLARARAVVLQDLPVGDALLARLKTFVEGGGGLILALGPRAQVPPADWLPVTVGTVEDRTRGAAAKLSGFDYGHAIFEPFRAPRSGDFSTTRVYGFRLLTARPGAVTLARFDGGTPALVEGTLGRGRVLVWATTLDPAWNDLALKPVYLPFVHQLVRQVAGYREQPGWVTVGQAIELGAPGASTVVLSPGGQRVSQPEGGSALEVTEAGFYDVRGAREGESLRVVASNVDLTESDLTRVDLGEVTVAVTGRPGGSDPEGPAAAVPDEVQEQAQRIWWYLLFAGILLLIAESWLARRTAPARL
jgi:uncharacterized membrane protein